MSTTHTQPAPSRQSFTDLIVTRFIARGVSASTALSLVHVKTGASLSALWNAYRGRRVSVETVKKISEWAYAEYGVEDLDVVRMLTAPVKGKP